MGEADEQPLTERDRIEDWREQFLIAGGYPYDYAIDLSRRLYIDVHRACDLLKAGCPVAVAVDILR